MPLLLLTVEFCFLFIAIPLLIYYRFLPNLPIPYLLAASTASFLLLRRIPGFQTSELFSLANASSHLPAFLLRDSVCLLCLAFAVRFFAPELLFSFVKRAPSFWALVMLLYPILSVFPQELLYRAFLFRRYEPLFGSGWGMILASVFAFGFGHIIFRNWLAVPLCVLGGALFAFTYHSSQSLLLACLEHALFGNFLFTIGLGKFFYHGSRF
jgi:uncharacterized protein